MVEFYLLNSFFILVVLTIILVKIGGNIQTRKSKTACIRFVMCAEIYIVLDYLFVRSFLNPEENVWLFRIIVFLFYLIYEIVPYAWYVFMKSYVDTESHKWMCGLEKVPLLILLGIDILSIPTGLLWRIESDGTYIRGKIFCLFSILNLFYYFASVVWSVYIVRNKEHAKVGYLFRSAFFSAIPLIGILVNTYMIPMYVVFPFQPCCLMVSTLLAYMFLVERQRAEIEAEHRTDLYHALEQEKAAAKKAQEAGAVKTTFLANMSHDIRTPMNAILGFADIIAKNPGNEQMVQDSISKIQASGDILLHIINDVLELSKIENGAVKIEEKVLDLNQMIERLRLMFAFSMKRDGLDFEIKTDIQNEYIWCDETKLQQILVNIISNAEKFTPKGGKVCLRITQKEENNGSAKYCFSVKDTGIGMTKEFQEHAFEAFERERTTTESKAEGTGLGLAIVKKLTDMMRGQAHIQSEAGKGTEISLYYNFRTASREELALEEEHLRTKIELSGKRVLVVEDNALNAEIAHILLAEQGALVEHAENGKQCLEKLKNEKAGHYDFILMDVQMPEMNGYEATQEIRQFSDKRKAGIPIIAMTANAFEEDRKNALMVGMNGFVSKPVRLEKLMGELGSILENG